MQKGKKSRPIKCRIVNSSGFIDSSFFVLVHNVHHANTKLPSDGLIGHISQVTSGWKKSVTEGLARMFGLNVCMEYKNCRQHDQRPRSYGFIKKIKNTDEMSK